MVSVVGFLGNRVMLFPFPLEYKKKKAVFDRKGEKVQMCACVCQYY